MSDPATTPTDRPAPNADNTELAPISKRGLQDLADRARADPAAVRTLRCRTVAEGRFRHANYVRDLPPHIIDEPPALLGDDTAPNPSEAALAALGSCVSIGLHANAVARGIRLLALELHLEGDLNISSVWGTGDVSDKPVGFTDVRIRVDMQADCPQEDIDALIAHVCHWSPVFNTFAHPVGVTTARF